LQMDWKVLSDAAELEELVKNSATRPQVIFKHSTRCAISSVAKSRLERGQLSEKADFYYLDLIAFRPLSQKISELFDVYHESPQVLIIRNGECVYDESHLAITLKEIQEHTEN